MTEPSRDSAGGVDVDEEAEPSALGAAATLPREPQRRARRTRTERAAAERATGGEATDQVESKRASEGSTGDEVVAVFEAQSLTKRPPVLQYVREVWGRRQFMDEYARAKIRGQRTSTALGTIWGLLDPLFQAVIYYLVFSFLRGDARGDFIPELVAGIFLFTLTTAALSQGGRSVRSASHLILNSTFPRAVLPVSAVYGGLISFAPTVLVYAVLYTWVGRPIHVGLLWLPVLFVIQMVMNLGISLLVSTVVVFFKDAENALSYVQRILFFTTPIIMPLFLILNAVPDSLEPFLALQPIFALFANYQLIIGANPIDMSYLLYSCLWAVGLLVVGGWLFLRYERRMASKV